MDVLFGQAYFLRFDPKLWEAQQPYAPLGALYAAACVRAARLLAWRCSTRCWRDRKPSGPRARSPSPALRGDLRRQLQLPEQDVPAAHAPGGADDDRRRAQSRRHRSSSPARTPAIIRRLYLDAAPTLVVDRRRRGHARSKLLDTLSGRSDRPLTRRSPGCACATPDGQLVQHAGRRDHPRSRRAAAPGLGSRRRRALPADLAGASRLLLDEPRDDARLPVSLQLVREADLRPALHRALAGARRRRDGVAEAHVSARSPVDRRRHLRPEAGLDRAVRRDRCRRATRSMPFKCLLRADQVTDATARALRHAGCRTVWIGAESGSQRMLDAMEKGTRVDQIADGDAAAARRRHRGRLLPAVRLSRRDARRHRAHAGDGPRAAGPTTSASRCRIRCPARRSTNASRPQLGEKQNWVDSDDLAMMYHATYVPGLLPGAARARARRIPSAPRARSARCARQAPAFDPTEGRA